MVYLFLAISIGSVFGLEGMKNTALVYLVLYIMEKFHEIKMNLMVEIFFFCLAVYFIALYLNTHPEVIISIFDQD